MAAAASSPAPALMPDEVILEILLRVPPEPIYLLRTSLVCRKWRDLIRDPAFLRRFRAHHRHAAPLVGFFREDGSFVPAGGEALDRVAAKHFSQLHGAGRWRVFDSRHGRVLLSAGNRSGEKLELLVWDPMTGHRTYISPPRNVLLGYPAANGLTYYERPDPLVRPPCIRAALVCNHDGDGEDDCHSRPFRVVLMFVNSGSMFAGVYSSQTGAWGDVTRVHGWWPSVSEWEPNSILAGNVLYWPELHGTELLGYNLGTNRLQRVEGFHPDDDSFDCVQVFRAADGELRLAAAFESSLYLFAPVATEEEDTLAWEECGELDLDALLPPPPAPVASSSSPPPVKRADAVGFDEDGNTIFLDMGDGVFSLHLQSMKANKILETGVLRAYRVFSLQVYYIYLHISAYI
jgi:hypothetical protein